MKIAFLASGIYPLSIGGMQKYAYYLTKHLLRQGVEVDLYHSENGTGEVEELFSAAERVGLRAFAVPFPDTRYFPGHYLFRFWRYSGNVLREFLPRRGVDFVYANGFAGWNLVVAKANGLAAPPVGVGFHGYEMFQPSSSVRERLEKAMFRPAVKANSRAADYVFTFGGQIRGIASQCVRGPDALLHVENGVDEAWIRSSSFPGNPVRRFLFVGRYERRKGIEELTSVLEDLLRADRELLDFHFIGPIPEELRAVSPAIRYHGMISSELELQRLFQSADVLVCPSRSEGMPTVILEAMASGLAVIATEVGAVAELVSPLNGWLIPPADRTALSAAILEAATISSEELSQKKIHGLTSARERFVWSRVAESFVEQITGVLRASAGGKVGQGQSAPVEPDTCHRGGDGHPGAE